MSDRVSLSGVQRAVLLASLVGLVAIVVLDLHCPDVRSFWTSHQMTAGAVLGLLLLPPVLFVFERIWHRRERDLEQLRQAREAEEWQQPAIDAIETFLFTGDAITGPLNDLIVEASEQLHLAGPAPKSLDDHLGRLATSDPGWFSELYRFSQDAANRLGALATSVVPVITRVPILAVYAGDLSHQQLLLRQIAEATRPITFLGANLSSAAQAYVDAAAQDISTLAFARMHALMDLKMRLEELSRELKLKIRLSELPETDALARLSADAAEREKYRARVREIQEEQQNQVDDSVQRYE